MTEKKLEKKSTKSSTARKSSSVKSNTSKNVEKYVEGVGRRKTSVARVRIFVNSKKKAGILINDKKLKNYFPTQKHQDTILSPLIKTDLNGQFFVSVKVKGGGVSSQTEAIRLGLARAIVEHMPNLKKKLRVFGYLTRDSRMVERKKYGLKKARKAPQWSKR